MSFAQYLRLVRDKTTKHGLCYAIGEVSDEAFDHFGRMQTMAYERRLKGHIAQVLEGYDTVYWCSMAGLLLDPEHPAYIGLHAGLPPFGKFFRIHWLNLAIEEVAHNDDNPLPPFFTREQLEELYEAFIKEQP